MFAPAQKTRSFRLVMTTDADLGMLEADALNRVGELDVDAEVVRVQLEPVVGRQAGVLLHVHRRASRPAPSKVSFQWRYASGEVSNLTAGRAVFVAPSMIRQPTARASEVSRQYIAVVMPLLCYILHYARQAGWAASTMTAADVVELVGRRVREARAGRAWTLRELAERSGVSMRFLVQLEAGRANISVRRLAEVARAFEIAPAALLLDTDERRR